MPILTSDGREVEKRYTADGKNVRTVYNSNGDIVFEEIDTAEGVLPQTFKSKGKPLVNYRIYGNTVQNGTPTPENPVEVWGCGVETENLAPPYTEWEPGYVKVNGGIGDSSDIRLEKYSDYLRISAGQKYLFYFNGDNFPYIPSNPAWLRVGEYDENYNFLNHYTRVSFSDNRFYFTTSEQAAYVRLSYHTFGQTNDTMLIADSTESITSYIPYGYKLDIISTNALESTSVTTPVYIGQLPLYKIDDYADYVDYKRGGVVRRIKELVLTGDENFGRSYNIFMVSGLIDNIQSRQLFLATHYKTSSDARVADETISLGISSATKNNIYIRDDAYTTVNDFNAYLAAQYAAGTPVKVYYVLATPEFEPIADLPKIPTFSPQTVLDTDMTVKPSKIWYKYKP